MKNILLTLLLLLGVCTASAQLIKEKAPVEMKYLAGAVPVVDGKVTFSCDIPVRCKMSQDTLFLHIHRWLSNTYNMRGVLKYADLGSNREQKVHIVGVNEYIVFKQKAFVLDRSQMIYRLSIQQEKDNLHVIMTDITYYYEEERDPVKLTAEEWITDENALSEDKRDLKRGHGKFRIQTIDLFDEITSYLASFMADLAQKQ